MKLIIVFCGGDTDRFEGPEWDWSFHDSYLTVWSTGEDRVTYRYPYTTIYRMEVK